MKGKHEEVHPLTQSLLESADVGTLASLTSPQVVRTASSLQCRPPRTTCPAVLTGLLRSSLGAQGSSIAVGAGCVVVVSRKPYLRRQTNAGGIVPQSLGGSWLLCLGLSCTCSTTVVSSKVLGLNILPVS